MRRAKRLADVVLSGAGLLTAAPLLCLASVAVWWEDGGPVLFRQERVGFRGRPFVILKLRTMRPDPEARGRQFTVRGDPRITRVGRMLRSTKLDELPQLVNVLRGEMTLVGPRPFSRANSERGGASAARIAEIMPGITDPGTLAFRWESDLLAQVADPERFYWEVVVPGKLAESTAYAGRASLRDDARVLLETVRAVFSGPEVPDPEALRARYAPDVPPEVARTKGA